MRRGKLATVNYHALVLNYSTSMVTLVKERERESCLSLPAGKTLHAAAAGALLLPASVTGRSATADWCRVGWSGRLRLSGGRVGPKYFAGAAAAGSTAGRTNQTLLTLLPSDTICPCASFNCFLPSTYISCCLCAPCSLG